MSKAKKIFITVIIFGVAGYGAYVYRDRIATVWNRSEEAPGSYEADFRSGDGNSAKDIVQTSPSPSGNVETKPSADNMSEEKLQEYLKDCENKCTNRSGDDYQYCLEICGMAPNNSSNGCDQRLGREKDTCLKNSAVKEKNDQLCEQINDILIRKSCVNAVADEILQ